MGDCKSVTSDLGGEENLIAAVQHIVKALGSNKSLTDDEKKILVDLGSKLSTINSGSENKGEEISEIEEQLSIIQESIMSWEGDQNMIWDSSLEEAPEYLKAVDTVQKLIERLERPRFNKDEGENVVLRRAYDVLQTAMARLEEEFGHLLVQNKQPFEPDHLSFRSSEEDIADVHSITSFEDDPVEDMLQRDSVSRSSEEFIIDMVRPHVIPDLKDIANLMFNSNYGQECSQAFICVQKETLDECLLILEINKLSIEEVLRMEWDNLNSHIKRWMRAMKIFVRVYLASEKWLIDQIFGELGSVNSVCFVEASKASMLQLLNFGEAIAISPHKPEKLSRILDMYEVLADLLPDIEALYIDEAGGSYVRFECQEVLSSLGESVRTTFFEFKNAIASNASANPFAGGGIHPLTRYVMNYIRNLTDYLETLCLLLNDHDTQDPISFSSPDMSPSMEGNSSGDSTCNVSPMALHFRSLISVLESNLDGKSKLYKDISLQHFFLMNNVYYMAKKVKEPELRPIFGDEWIRKHNWKYQQYAMNYERATWSSILSSLKDDGLQNPNSCSLSRTLLKERFRSFYAAFEEVYKTQTGWVIPDPQLREDLRISTSLKVVQAYRTFVGRHRNNIGDRHIKYSADDLENFLLDLFEGSPGSLQNSHRR